MEKSFIEIAGRKIGPDHPPFVIADIGINHEGDMAKAKQMIVDAHRVGAECIKFQCHVVEDEMVPVAKNIIPGHAKESIWDIMEKCSFSEEQDRELKDYVESFGMIYLNTPFSRAAADRLERIGVVAYKIGSGECNNYPLIKHIVSFHKPIILSTGMNDIPSIKKSVEIIRSAQAPYALMHCVSMYPTPYNKVRLGALSDLHKNFPDAVIGISDHSVGNYTCFAAVALGASLVEKHFVSDKNWPGPDVPVSIDPAEFKQLITGTEAIYQASGGSKEILAEEQPIIDFAYACVVTIKDVKSGEEFTRENIWVKRPGTGEIKAVEYENILGRCATQDIPKDIQLKNQHLCD
ncbi:MAG: N-acylneuraminate-9-phosphate synthase [Candidatus Magasanikbacteria bacterium GW2011_GWC2_41_17]|uniref:N-acylneuraminate-9-phosphate synthase n=2 Tax=Candidatus Magasanikiibacteriota TaxID=1752731 RepID=A0A0G0WNJ3_9BACT|nr:MAG: N-acylneuraminate-9-phosphate synthase [Candidatus Magasanikbacteria bacterium GW2011_GWC2_41_17]KKS13632.1 MAG: N-acylneuraminate-9-phosphate synthase [Candidatus Magasanikbacteria bacterium GW2011_GWA2_41_55]